jgi:hypothetical protein
MEEGQGDLWRRSPTAISSRIPTRTRRVHAPTRDCTDAKLSRQDAGRIVGWRQCLAPGSLCWTDAAADIACRSVLGLARWRCCDQGRGSARCRHRISPPPNRSSNARDCTAGTEELSTALFAPKGWTFVAQIRCTGVFRTPTYPMTGFGRDCNWGVTKLA